MRLSHINNNSSIYGFEEVFALWTQGCKLRCKGCWNESMHNFDDGFYISVEDLISQIKESIIKYNINGVSILGGEPLDQDLDEMISLLKAIKDLDIGIIFYTGYEKEEINNSNKIKVLDYIDVLISGRYIEEKRNVTNHLYGSENQSMDFLSGRYKEENIINGTYVEIDIDYNGSINMYGYPDDFFDLIK